MTAKRLNVAETPIEELECPKKYVYDTGIIFECGDGFRSEILGEDVVKLLNELTTKCSQLEKENEQLRKDVARYRRNFREMEDIKCELADENKQLKSDMRDNYKKYKELLDENEQLKQRNNRQAKRLRELYELMAKKDWESLTEIIDDFCSCEEQLQREWKCYE